MPSSSRWTTVARWSLALDSDLSLPWGASAYSLPSSGSAGDGTTERPIQLRPDRGHDLSLSTAVSRARHPPALLAKPETVDLEVEFPGLRRRNEELERTNEILKTSACFAPHPLPSTAATTRFIDSTTSPSTSQPREDCRMLGRKDGRWMRFLATATLAAIPKQSGRTQGPYGHRCAEGIQV